MKQARTHDPREALRLALSHREKATILSRQGQAAHDQGRIDDTRYRSVKEFHNRHFQRAEEKLRHLRLEHQRRAEKIRAEIQALARKQMELPDRVNEREMTIDRANGLNRKYVARIGELRAQYAEEQRLARVDDPRELGGFIDLPLDQYEGNGAARAAAPVASRPQAVATRWERIAVTALALLASLSVFLPWLQWGGEARTLAGVIGGVLGAMVGAGADGEAALPGMLIAGLMVVYLAAPLVTALFAWIEAPRAGGAGMVAAALVVVLLGLATVPAAAAVAGLPYVEAFAGLRLGGAAYILGGVLLGLIGAGRTSRRVDGVAGGRSKALLILATLLAVAGLAAGTHYGLRTSESTVILAADPPAAGTGIVEIVLTNEGPSPVRVFLPWPEARLDSPLVESRRNTIGALVYIREAVDTDYRVYPMSHAAWEMRGAIGGADAGFDLAAGVSQTVVFSPQRIRSEGVDPEAARVVFTDGRGRELLSLEVQVPPGPGA